MAKSRPQSKHSRAARRAASPSLDVDKSLTSLPRAEEPVRQRDSILAERENAGVIKKKSKPKAMSRAQKLRQQKGVQRAEAVENQLEIKVAKAVTRGKAIKARSGDWEDFSRKSSKTMFQNLADEADDDNAMIDGSGAPQTKRTKPQPTIVAPNPEPDVSAGIDMDDDIS
ncbi:hypothetical protein FE257_003281 [Aspergillus nanangensis]|uniref:Alb1-domain-containing protein n=1 Tax=Aspergillus nanangensis TaxID=2582783 RepID=A0AAD4CSB6_ASPNN|nr:hypothetical protein FE257_003281 [Aspergillus nanangensis]